MTLPKPEAGTVAVITGASAGIGAELARGLAARGHDLLLIARREPLLRALADELEGEHHVRAEVAACDLADRAMRASLCERLRSTDVSVLCNNAGFATFGDLRRADSARERDEIEVNVVAVHELTLAVLPGMVRRDRGAILITGSTAGNQPLPGSATYAGSKAFANVFAESLHGELARTGVSCALLAPGPVRTEFSRAAGVEHLDRSLGLVSVSASLVAAEALTGLERGNRTIVPGMFAKLQTLGGRYAPRGALLPVLHLVSRGLS